MAIKRLISFEEIAETSSLFHDLDRRPDWKQIFQNSNPIKLEIGFGNGSFLIEMAIRQPNMNFVGIDMFHKGIRKVVTKANRLGITNLRIAYGDARLQVPMIFEDHQLREAFINFPDPWPKKKHHKRRLIKPEFLHILAQKIEYRGSLRLATDYTSYAEEMLEHLNSSPDFENLASSGGFSASRNDLPRTKYENNFIMAGDHVFYLDFVRQ